MNRFSRRIFVQQTGCAAAATFIFRSPLFVARENLPARLASDRTRPQYHLLPAANWMNDPNGPIYYKGRYHMFFQYNPNGAFWGSMHWGHATSPDMIHWQHEPIALAPTPGGYDRDGVFSGSAILNGDTPTLIYTGVLPPASASEITLNDGQHKWREVQCLATAKDPDLRSWKKLQEPVIARPPEHLAVTGFRDPGVWREGKEWLLTLGSGIRGKGGAVLLYESRDLQRWAFRHPLIEGHGRGNSADNPVDNGEMWECPDFFALGDRHVLLLSTMGKVLWKTGRYRDRRFTAEREGVVDFGAYYAAKTMVDEGGNRILWGWIPETRPEAEYRAAGWAGVMALPRILSLGTDGGLRMAAAPAVEMLRTRHTQVRASTDRNGGKELAGIRIRDLAGEIQARFAAQRGFLLHLRPEKGEAFAEIAYDPQKKDAELRVNNTSGAFATNEPITLRVFLDGSVLEVFANDKTVITARVYVASSSPLRVEVSDIDSLEALDVWQMRPISKDRLSTG
ncbi:MAG: glycoside hydrolase family 32 protein [Terriglobales bacterium]